MKAYNDIDLLSNGWNSSAWTDMYKNTFAYDANGNIDTLKRYDASGTLFDSLIYKYLEDGSGNLKQNRLYHVNDAATPLTTGEDITDQGTFVSTEAQINIKNNYNYDELGNLKKDSAEGIANIEWTVYGKVKKITYTTLSEKPSIEFAYDAMGNRISKTINYEGHPSTTYYIRDAQGNIMTTYELRQNEVDVPEVFLEDLHLYGSSRLGALSINETMGDLETSFESNTFVRMLGNKQFELSNHLGNVLATVSDRKIAHDNNGTIDYYTADITSSQDYYPFGMLMPGPGRNFSPDAYRFGFNGKEKDDEIKGNGNSLDFGARIYDPRVGRWLACDPQSNKYPYLTPYQFCANNPNIFVDPDGEKIKGVSYNTETGQFEYSKAAIRRGTDKYVSARITTETGKANIMKIMDDPKRFKITVTDKILVGISGVNQYTVEGGETVSRKFMVFSTSTIGTGDLMKQGNQSDKLTVYTTDQSGNIHPKVILRNQLANTLTAPDPNNKYQAGYSKAYKESGMEAYDVVEPTSKTDVQLLHRTGAHEETHLLQEDIRTGNLEKDTYNTEMPAMENEIKESEEYIRKYENKHPADK